MAKAYTGVQFGENNPATIQKTDAEAQVAWSPLEVLKAGDLNGFFAWVASFALSASNEIANLLTDFGYTPDPTVTTQLTEFMRAIDEKINQAATAGALLGTFWYGKTKSATVVPNPTDASQNYFDFTTNTSYTANSDLSGWTQDEVIVPPSGADARIVISSKFWDVTEISNTGGFAYWAYQAASWSYVPNVGTYNSIAITGVSTAPTPTSTSPAKQISNKEYADTKVAKSGDTMQGNLNMANGASVILGDNSAIEFDEQSDISKDDNDKINITSTDGLGNTITLSIDPVSGVITTSKDLSNTLTGLQLVTAKWVKDAINAGVATALPVGAIIPYGGTGTPTNYLLCDGSLISRQTYATLYNAIGTLYGEGDGSTTFQLPDLRDRFIEGGLTPAYVEAGLPNITGVTIGGPSGLFGITVSGAFYNARNRGTTSGYTPGNGQWQSSMLDAGLDASRSNAIYGKSTTVQPNACVLRQVIKYI